MQYLQVSVVAMLLLNSRDAFIGGQAVRAHVRDAPILWQNKNIRLHHLHLPGRFRDAGRTLIS
jgi:hypothetical protein